MESFDVELIEEYRHPLSLQYKSYDLASELAGISTGRKKSCLSLKEGEASFLVHYGVEKSLIENGEETKEGYLTLLYEVNKMLIEQGFARQFEGPRGNHIIKEIIENLKAAQTIGAKFVPGDLEEIERLLATLTNK